MTLSTKEINMKELLFLITLGLITSVGLVGCGDEDDATDAPVEAVDAEAGAEAAAGEEAEADAEAAEVAEALSDEDVDGQEASEEADAAGEEADAEAEAEGGSESE